MERQRTHWQRGQRERKNGPRAGRERRVSRQAGKLAASTTNWKSLNWRTELNWRTHRSHRCSQRRLVRRLVVVTCAGGNVAISSNTTATDKRHSPSFLRRNSRDIAFKNKQKTETLVTIIKTNHKRNTKPRTKPYDNIVFQHRIVMYVVNFKIQSKLTRLIFNIMAKTAVIKCFSSKKYALISFWLK